MTTVPPRRDYPVGYRRGDVPELMSFADVVAASERTGTGVRRLIKSFPEEFPVPVQVLGAATLYMADEVRAFFVSHPRRSVVDAEVIDTIQGMWEGGSSAADIAAHLDLHVNTVRNHIS